MSDFEVMPIGTIEAMRAAAQVLRREEHSHHGLADLRVAQGRSDRIQRTNERVCRAAAERLEGLLRERNGGKPVEPPRRIES